MSRNRTTVDLPKGAVLHTSRGVFKGKAPADLVPKEKPATKSAPTDKKGSK